MWNVERTGSEHTKSWIPFGLSDALFGNLTFVHDHKNHQRAEHNVRCMLRAGDRSGSPHGGRASGLPAKQQIQGLL